MGKFKQTSFPLLVENYLNKFFKGNEVIELSEVTALPPTEFSVEPALHDMGPGDGVLNMPTGSGGQWMLNPKLPWNWSPQGGWPDGYKFKDPHGHTWTYDKETDSWYVKGKDGRNYERIPHGRPDRYWQGPNFNTQPPENDEGPRRPTINRPGYPEPGVMPGYRR